MSTTIPEEPILVRCPRCRRHIDVASIPTSEHALCPDCGREFRAARFDPPPREAALTLTLAGTLDAGQPCAHHPRNAAVTGCQRCGSFICALCRIDVDERTLCPNCFGRLSSEGSLESTRTTFRDYPGLAGVTATAGCLVWFLSIVFGPLTIYYALKGLKQKKEMGEDDGRIMMWIAIGIGVIQIVGGLVLIGVLIAGMLQ